MKSPLLHVPQILFAGEQRPAAKPRVPASRRLLSQSPDQVVHDGRRNSSLLARINVTEQYQMAEQHTPIGTEAINQMFPIHFLRAAHENMRNIAAIEPSRSMMNAFIQIISSGAQSFTCNPSSSSSCARSNHESSTSHKPLPARKIRST